MRLRDRIRGSRYEVEVHVTAEHWVLGSVGRRLASVLRQHTRARVKRRLDPARFVVVSRYPFGLVDRTTRAVGAMRKLVGTVAGEEGAPVKADPLRLNTDPDVKA